ncbi:UNKNOWN [Stylonychia lemnae]|uniref:Uncharacterized protein n=1 Tax=Stylonychia lemnae TaxID=5949 RepID=A0A078AKB9_STYLE|nr:UNKNOWN [Stylonychia lemnae]|eukprot:CDW82830.1 UNKNOWN [Stylonychia lemnae]
MLVIENTDGSGYSYISYAVFRVNSLQIKLGVLQDGSLNPLMKFTTGFNSGRIIVNSSRWQFYQVLHSFSVNYYTGDIGWYDYKSDQYCGVFECNCRHISLKHSCYMQQQARQAYYCSKHLLYKL